VPDRRWRAAVNGPDADRNSHGYSKHVSSAYRYLNMPSACSLLI